MTLIQDNVVLCRWCGRAHSDWLSCTAAELMEPAVPYTSGGTPEVMKALVAELETVNIEIEDCHEPEKTFDRSAHMKAWHARKREQKGGRRK